MELEEKVAIVTGAAALRLAREGAAVVVDEDTGSSIVREIRSQGGRAAFVLAEEEFGGLDWLVNNAGGVEEPYFPDGEPEHWGRAIDLNLRGTMLGIHLEASSRLPSGALRHTPNFSGSAS